MSLERPLGKRAEVPFEAEVECQAAFASNDELVEVRDGKRHGPKSINRKSRHRNYRTPESSRLY